MKIIKRVTIGDQTTFHCTDNVKLTFNNNVCLYGDYQIISNKTGYLIYPITENNPGAKSPICRLTTNSKLLKFLKGE